jgi:Fe-S cluster assembly scaffold protein SufB
LVVVYKLKDHARLPIPAQVAGESLENIRSLNGGVITPAVVVDNARDKKSPLHPCFEWNDKRAAEAHRLDQARYLLRAVVVTYGEPEEEKAVRAFVTVTEDKQEVYTDIREALQNPEHREQVLSRARRELEQWAKRYEHLQEFSSLISQIRELSAA